MSGTEKDEQLTMTKAKQENIPHFEWMSLEDLDINVFPF